MTDPLEPQTSEPTAPLAEDQRPPTPVPSATGTGQMKADTGKRALAFIIDIAVAWLLSAVIPTFIGPLLGALYLLLRDGFAFEYMDGRSLGKRLIGLRPVRLDGGKVDLATSASRNWTIALASLAGSFGIFGVLITLGLVLLLIMTVLGVSGMSTATLELTMAGNAQAQQIAFQAAETGIEIALSQGSFNTLTATALPRETLVIPDRNFDTVDVEIEFEDTSLVPDKAFSLGVGSGIAAYHFNATAVAESARAGIGAANDTDRDASAVHTQAFYVVGPEAPTL